MSGDPGELATSCFTPATSAAASHAYMSLSHPSVFRVSSGVSVRATNSAHSGATARRSRTLRHVGAFPVGGRLNSFAAVFFARGVPPSIRYTRPCLSAWERCTRT